MAFPGKREFRSFCLYKCHKESLSLGPDELLNQDVKTNAVGRRRPHNRVEMLRNVRSY